MSKKIRVWYTVHTSAHNVEKMSTVFTVSDVTAAELAMMTTPAERSTFPGFNLKTAIYWTTRLMDYFFDPDDQILSIKEVKK